MCHLSSFDCHASFLHGEKIRLPTKAPEEVNKKCLFLSFFYLPECEMKLLLCAAEAAAQSTERQKKWIRFDLTFYSFQRSLLVLWARRFMWVCTVYILTDVIFSQTKVTRRDSDATWWQNKQFIGLFVDKRLKQTHANFFFSLSLFLLLCFWRLSWHIDTFIMYMHNTFL